MPDPQKTIHDGAYRVLVDCLKDARQVAKFTQVQLAAALNTDQSYVSKYERVERRLDLIEVRTICNALGVDFRHFVDTFESALRAKRLS